MGNDIVESSFYKELCGIIDKSRIKVNEPLSAHTTFRIGGPAALFVEAKADREISGIISLARREAVPYYIIGNGSNLLAGDGGFEGIVIAVHKEMTALNIDGTSITVEAGVLLSALAAAAQKASLTGLEFAAGIPGTVGGGIVMNAGAYGGELKQVLKRAWVLDESGELIELDNEALELGYRTSIFKKRSLVCVRAEFVLSNGDAAAIRARMDELNAQRREKQPLEYPSAGSTFKRPEGYFAGKLIQDAGLRGFQLGGARVSDKHCGFVINAGSATAADVLQLIDEVSARVKEQTGVTLEPEICMIGRF